MNLNRKHKHIIFIVSITLIIFASTYAVLIFFGFAPQAFQVETKDVVVEKNIFQIIGGSTDTNNDLNLIPQKIEIPKINVSSYIQIPSSIDVAVLDGALSRGAVYYPGSGTVSEGNMFIFGHSTNWKIVNNQAYKTFNNLDKLVVGDVINITSGDFVYVYEVTNVRRADQNDVLVEFDKGERMLTISTCDTFGQKQDRWVVEANFLKRI